jgi:xylulose-5-phosphate/fructose-6-phosphate phosphoketolase
MPRAKTDFDLINRYWQAANYLSVGQIYLQRNALLREPLQPEHIKPRLLGHWGTTAGLNFIYAHLNRVIKAHDLNMILITGPGHGGPGLIANTYLEGSYTERFPAIERNADGVERLCRQFSWPYGVPSHAAPETPGSIHEGGELGYSLAHAYGAAFDNPDLIVTCIVGDGEAETGALATSWHCNKFSNPARDGAVLPILHLNGYKIANPTILARIGRDELTSLLKGYGYAPIFVEGHMPAAMHRKMAAAMDKCIASIALIKKNARRSRQPDRPRWPMIVLVTPKGWTGPKEVDGLPVEGTWRAHQVPIDHMDKPGHLKLLEKWLKSYRPDRLFDGNGKLKEDLTALPPTGHRRLGMNPHANGGELLVPLSLPQFRDFAIPIEKPGAVEGEATRVLGKYLAELFVLNAEQANFRLFGPDETASNRLDAVYKATKKVWMASTKRTDTDLATDGRVLEVLSEHLCQGWLEGYLLTGRHGLFNCYEAFTHIVDSMVNQHAKWLKVSKEIPWRAPIASLNYLLSSHVWRQDHNGFSHQDPGFIDHIANKKSAIARIYLPPDANCLLSVMDHCLKSRNYINVVVAGKQPAWQWLDMDSAERHCVAGASIWHWAGHQEEDPDVVMACAGDIPTMETLAAVMLLREHVPDLKIRVVNVVDLMTLSSPTEHPHGFNDHDFSNLFTENRPVIFAYHGYPTLIHKLTYNRTNHRNFHVHGYNEEGTTTTPFDMVVLNKLDRFSLMLNAVKRVPRLGAKVGDIENIYWSAMQRHKLYISEHGKDMPEINDWRWAPV